MFFLPTDTPLDGARLSTPQTEVQVLEADTLPLDQVGIYRIETEAYRAELYANLFDEAESNIGRQIANEIPPSTSSGVRASPEAVQREIPVEFGQSLYWLAALLLFGEWLYALWRSPLEGVS